MCSEIVCDSPDVKRNKIEMYGEERIFCKCQRDLSHALPDKQLCKRWNLKLTAARSSDIQSSLHRQSPLAQYHPSGHSKCHPRYAVASHVEYISLTRTFHFTSRLTRALAMWFNIHFNGGFHERFNDVRPIPVFKRNRYERSTTYLSRYSNRETRVKNRGPIRARELKGRKIGLRSTSEIKSASKIIAAMCVHKKNH